MVGALGLRKRGRAAEAAVIGAVAITYFLYNAGYWLPFGGGSPGPRFLIPALPFLALGLGSAYRRLPALTLALAIPSVIFMLAGALTYPLIGDNGTGIWANQLGSGTLEHTLLTVLGVRNGWLAIAPVLAAVATAIVFAALATPRTRLGNVRPGARRGARLGGGLDRRADRGRRPGHPPRRRARGAEPDRGRPWWPR